MAGNSLMFAMRMILLIPFLAAMGYGLLMTKFSQEMQSGEPGFATEIVSKVGIAWLTNRVEKKRDAIVDTASLNDDRVVSFNRKVAVTDLPGGAAGDLSEHRAEIAGLAVAKQMAEAECANMIKSFATACQFNRARVQISDEGVARLEIALSFASATPIGATEGLENAALIPQSIKLTEGDGYRGGEVVALADLPKERDRIYAAADAACAALRAEKGNCVVSRLHFDENPTEDGQVMLAAAVEIAYLSNAVMAGTPGTLSARGADSEATMMAFALKMMMGAQKAMNEGDAAAGAMPKPDELPVDAKTLLDDVKLPSFEKTQGGAKFVSPP
jgi:hypothetical protein